MPFILRDLQFSFYFALQYLELRFSKAVRICGTLAFIFQMVGAAPHTKKVGIPMHETDCQSYEL